MWVTILSLIVFIWNIQIYILHTVFIRNKFYTLTRKQILLNIYKKHIHNNKYELNYSFLYIKQYIKITACTECDISCSTRNTFIGNLISQLIYGTLCIFICLSNGLIFNRIYKCFHAGVRRFGNKHRFTILVEMFGIW